MTITNQTNPVGTSHLSKKIGVQKAVKFVKKEKRVDVLINCAGNFSVKSIMNSSYKEVGYFYLHHLLLKLLQDKIYLFLLPFFFHPQIPPLFHSWLQSVRY